MRAWPIIAVVMTVACSDTPLTGPSSESPGGAVPGVLRDSDEPVPEPTPGPTPDPTPTTIAIIGTILDTVTGLQVGTFTHTADGLPAKVTVSVPGYIPRDTWVRTATPRIDLFPERGFDLPFYRQLVRNDLERGGDPLYPLVVLPQAPAFYVETEGRKGFPRQSVSRLEELARRLVPQLTGGRFQVTRWETGPTPRERQAGWIVIERLEEAGLCGRAYVGALAGQILMSDHPGCRLDSTFAHELGHAFGFWHVTRFGTMMYPQAESQDQSTTDAPNEIERHHMGLAYARQRGNTDTDVDPPSPVPWVTAALVD
jgi:hypothetical protein